MQGVMVTNQPGNIYRARGYDMDRKSQVNIRLVAKDMEELHTLANQMMNEVRWDSFTLEGPCYAATIPASEWAGLHAALGSAMASATNGGPGSDGFSEKMSHALAQAIKQQMGKEGEDIQVHVLNAGFMAGGEDKKESPQVKVGDILRGISKKESNDDN